MDIILDILGSAGFGSLLGGVFGYLTKREERANMQMKFNHKVDMLEATTDSQIRLSEAKIEETRVAGELDIEKEETKAFTESQKSKTDFSEYVKSCVRPLILIILFYQTYRILSSLEEITGGLEVLPPSEVLDLYRIVVLSVTGLTATAVGWYFAARTSKQFDKIIGRWDK